MDDKEKKKIILEYQILQSRLNNLVKERDEIAQKILEVTQTINSVNGFTQNDDIIFSIGSGVFAKGKPKNDKFLVEIGSSIILEKNREETKKILEERKKELENALSEVEKEISRIGNEMQNIANKVSDQNVQSS